MLTSKKKPGIVAQRNARRRNLHVESLELRRLMAVVMSVDAAGLLSIRGDLTADNITVYQSGVNTMVQSSSNGGMKIANNLGSKVKSLDIRTFNGNDTVNNNTALPARIYGGMGNDTLIGGSVRDYLYGEDGTDTLRGNAGIDYIYGGNHNDKLYGNAGVDFIYGGGGNDVIFGGGGSDWIYGEAGEDTLYGDDSLGATFVDGEAAGKDNLSGGEDGDKLYGGVNDDVLRGGNGNDYLYGQDGNDRLYGDQGVDNLYGMNDDDFLDTGSTGELFVGGEGNDFIANRPVINGATTDDIAQGVSENCFILAGMGAAAARGVDLASRITHVGLDSYNVSLFKRNAAGTFSPIKVLVYFDGTTRATDPTAHFRGQEGESWTIIMNRAIAQVLNVDLATTYGGDSGDALAVIVGRPKSTISWTDNSGYSSPLYRDPFLDSLYSIANAAPSIAASRGTNAELSSNQFVANHAYIVKSVVISSYTYSPASYQYVPQYTFTLANPWGKDHEQEKINNGTARASGDNNDGVLVISGAEFKRNFRALILA